MRKTRTWPKAKPPIPYGFLNGRKPAYGVWYDVEDSQQAGCDLAVICDTYCRAMEAAGLYGNLFLSILAAGKARQGPVLDKYDKWVADWGYLLRLWEALRYLAVYGQPGDRRKRLTAIMPYKDYPSLTKGGNPVSTKSGCFLPRKTPSPKGLGMARRR